MSSTIAQPSNMKSMNGIITYDDGAGTTISNGSITSNQLSTQNISAPNTAADSQIYYDTTSSIFLGGPLTTGVFVQIEPTTPYAVANKEYVDSVAGGGVSLSSTNVWTGQNTFNTYAPLCSVSPSTDSNLANKLYVDTVAGTIGGDLLASNNIFTGINQFNGSATSIGKSDQSSEVTIAGEVLIGNGVYSPGPSTTILGSDVIIKGFANCNLISNITTFGNASTPAVARINIASTDKVELDFNTYSGDRSITTSQIVATNGTAFNNGELEIYGGDITIGNADESSNVTLFGEVFIGNAIASPGPKTTMVGDTVTIAGTQGCFLIANQTSIGNASTPGLATFDIATLNKVELDFKTYSTDRTKVTSSIVATGGSNTLNGDLTFNGGNIYYGNSDNSTTHTFRGTVNIPSTTSNTEFFNTAKTISLQIDPNTTANTVYLNYKTNSSSVGTITSSLVASGGSGAGTGNLKFKGNTFTVTNNAETSSVVFDESNTGLARINFRSNSADPTMNTASIDVEAGTTAYGGKFVFASATSLTNASTSYIITTPIFRISAISHSLQFQTSTTGQIDMLFRTNTANNSQTSSSIVATGGGGGAGTGTLTTACGVYTVNALTSATLSSPTTSVTGTTTATVSSPATSVTGTTTASVSSPTTTITGTTTLNLSSASTVVSGALYVNNASGVWKLWSPLNSETFIQYSANGDILCDQIPLGAILTTRYGFATAITLTLLTANQQENGFFTIYNAGSANITLAAQGGSNRLFGPSLSRGGVSSLVIGSNTSRRIRGVTFNGTTNFLNNTLGSGFYVEIG